MPIRQLGVKIAMFMVTDKILDKKRKSMPDLVFKLAYLNGEALQIFTFLIRIKFCHISNYFHCIFVLMLKFVKMYRMNYSSIWLAENK